MEFDYENSHTACEGLIMRHDRKIFIKLCLRGYVQNSLFNELGMVTARSKDKHKGQTWTLTASAACSSCI